jgi:hypothetical protein
MRYIKYMSEILKIYDKQSTRGRVDAVIGTLTFNPRLVRDLALLGSGGIAMAEFDSSPRLKVVSKRVFDMLSTWERPPEGVQVGMIGLPFIFAGLFGRKIMGKSGEKGLAESLVAAWRTGEIQLPNSPSENDTPAT